MVPNSERLEDRHPGEISTVSRKQEYKLFRTKEAAEAEIREILNRGSTQRTKISKQDEAALLLAQKYGLTPHQHLAAIQMYKEQIDKVTKFATVEECAAAFITDQEHENRSRLTLNGDRGARVEDSR